MALLKNYIYFIIVFFCCTFTANGGEILFLIYPSTSSHKIFLKPLMESLMSRGHKLTVITNLDKSLALNVTAIPLEPNTDNIRNVNKMCFDDFRNKPWQMFREFEKYLTNKGNDHLLRNDKIKRMIHERRRFDVVFTGGLFEEYCLPIAALFSDNIVFVHFMRVLPSYAHEMGIIQPYSYIPFVLSKFKTHMKFLDRVSNALLSFYFAVILRDLSQMDKHVADSIPEAPSVTEVHSRISLIFLNSDPVMYNAVPIMPHVISVGGMNCRRAKPLPQDLNYIMNSSGDHGVIYFSMGTVIDLRKASKHLPQVFLNVFSRLNQTVLWKLSFDLENVPANVKLLKWAPQQDILGDPNLRLYIMQGGIFSLQEAIYHGVPILGLPVFADQFSNVVRIQELGLGLHLDIFSITTEKLYSSILQIINDPGYQERSKKYSNIFKDQSESPIERAVYWTEFLINHPKSSFRLSFEELNLFQYQSLDILLIIIIMIFVCLWIPIKLLIY